MGLGCRVRVIPMDTFKGHGVILTHISVSVDFSIHIIHCSKKLVLSDAFLTLLIFCAKMTKKAAKAAAAAPKKALKAMKAKKA